eukprot:TRINITY_DN6719_c0_g1_i1.p1 TRINITY_DN6719_c0_g1~~TRINITY_DN6719_c0_g1_i1.p1  ORF type:complete len:463 (+),score=76.13 TRINITY_DN6719_c0_g1_i1:159-1547(+)
MAAVTCQNTIQTQIRAAEPCINNIAARRPLAVPPPLCFPSHSELQESDINEGYLEMFMDVDRSQAEDPGLCLGFPSLRAAWDMTAIADTFTLEDLVQGSRPVDADTLLHLPHDTWIASLSSPPQYMHRRDFMAPELLSGEWPFSPPPSPTPNSQLDTCGVAPPRPDDSSPRRIRNGMRSPESVVKVERPEPKRTLAKQQHRTKISIKPKHQLQGCKQTQVPTINTSRSSGLALVPLHAERRQAQTKPTKQSPHIRHHPRHFYNLKNAWPNLEMHDQEIFKSSLARKGQPGPRGSSEVAVRGLLLNDVLDIVNYEHYNEPGRQPPKSLLQALRDHPIPFLRFFAERYSEVFGEDKESDALLEHLGKDEGKAGMKRQRQLYGKQAWSKWSDELKVMMVVFTDKKDKALTKACETDLGLDPMTLHKARAVRWVLPRASSTARKTRQKYNRPCDRNTCSKCAQYGE